MNQEKLKAAARRLFVPNYAAAAIVLERGRGCRVWDGAGSEYLDFGAGISVNSLGHCNAGVTQAVTNQAAALNHVSNLYYNRPSIALAEKLLGACFAERVFFCNSGSEANEAAIKLARKFSSLHHANHKREIVTFSGAFHGRTLAALTATANPAYQEGFGPLPGGFVSCAFNDFAAAEKTIGAKTCAVMVEPVQGESGIHPAAPGFLGHLRNLCDRHNALLMVDEIQCGARRATHRRPRRPRRRFDGMLPPPRHPHPHRRQRRPAPVAAAQPRRCRVGRGHVPHRPRRRRFCAGSCGIARGGTVE